MLSPRLEESSHSLWHNRRIQRCLGFAGVLILLVAFAIYSPYSQDLNLETITSLAKTKTGTGTGTTPHKSAGDKTITTVLDHTRVALLIESRPLPIIPALLTHFISVIPQQWTFRFVGSPDSIKIVKASHSLSAYIKSGKLIVTKLPAEYPMDGGQKVSESLTNLSFYRDFLAPAEWVLFFQSDSMVCSASEKTLDYWVDKKYTWVGAPWFLGEGTGGNGGLSLRHLPPIIKLLETEHREEGGDLEDLWLCNRLKDMKGTNMPSADIERYFSVESQWSEKPFGYHLRGTGKLLVPEIWGNATRRKEIFEYCPEVSITLEMDLKSEIERLENEVLELRNPKPAGSS